MPRSPQVFVGTSSSPTLATETRQSSAQGSRNVGAAASSAFLAFLRRLVTLIRFRWRVERDYQKLKSEIGLDHFEGRTWRGFHHHATLCAVA